MDEFGLIRRLAERLDVVRDDVRIGIGDDAAVLSAPTDEELLVTTDTMVQGVHFLDETMSWFDVGYKCLAASISDVAAMGGQPRHATLSLAVPKDLDMRVLDAFYDGVNDVSRRYQCAVVGGDVVGTAGPAVFTSTVIGTVPAGRAITRAGAVPGDLVFATGLLGGSGAGLRLLLHPVSVPEDEANVLRAYHQRPIPQVTAGMILRDAGATSCNDVSDGLASELNEIAAASQVRLRVEAARVPIAPQVHNFARRMQEQALDYAWYGGEDYQLVGTISPFGFARALSICESVGIQLTQIGRVEAGEGVVVEEASGQYKVLEPRGYNHFQNSALPDSP